MTRVLVIDEALPYPPDSGKRIRTWELLTRLANTFDITLAYHDEGTPKVAVEALRDAGIEPLPVPRPRLEKRGAKFAWDLFRNAFLPVPYMVMAHRTHALQQAVRAAHGRTPFELVHVEWTPLAANALAIVRGERDQAGGIRATVPVRVLGWPGLPDPEVRVEVRVAETGEFLGWFPLAPSFAEVDGRVVADTAGTVFLDPPSLEVAVEVFLMDDTGGIPGACEGGTSLGTASYDEVFGSRRLTIDLTSNSIRSGP